jgi:hypothetical protein
LEHSVGSIFISHLNKKNNWEEIFGLFIQAKVWLERNVGQSEGGGTGCEGGMTE